MIAPSFHQIQICSIITYHGITAKVKDMDKQPQGYPQMEATTFNAPHRPVSPAALDSLYRKVTLRLLPFLMLCYIAAFLDRVNIGFAKLQMLQDLGFSATIYGLGAGLFFFGYFIFEVPSTLMLHRFGARLTLMRIMVIWAVISACFMFVKTPTQFYVLRFLLGAAEAGFYPGIILYLTRWYPSSRRAKIIAMFITAIPISGIVGGPLSGWVLSSSTHWGGLMNWQWLFFIEALPSLVLGLLTLVALDDSVSSAKWLSESEKNLLSVELDEEKSPSRFSKKNSLLQAMASGYVWLLVVICFCQGMGQYALSFWLPTLIRQAGISNPLQVGLVSAIPFAVAVVSMLLVSRSSDARMERRWHLIVPFLVAAVGLLLSAKIGSTLTVSLLTLSVAAAGCYSVSAMFWSIPPAFLSGVGAAGGIALINSFGSLAGFVSPFMVGAVKDATHSTEPAMHLLAATMLLGAMLTYFVPSRIVNR
nr:MFS transporter [Burkholderia cepacia]